MSRFKAVLFDYDDTLANTYSARVKAARKGAAGRLSPDLDLDRLMKEWAGRPQFEIFSDLAEDKAQVDSMMADYVKWYWRMSPTEVSLFPGVMDMLQGLKGTRPRRTIALVTSKVRLLENEDGPYGAEVEMKRLGILSLFDLIVGWEDVKESKPMPGPILFAVEELGLKRDEVIMVGDSHIDIRTAKNAGVASAGATWGTLAKDLLLEVGPDYILDSPSDLMSILE